MNAESRRSKFKRPIFATIAIAIGLLFGLAIVEVFARVTEPERANHATLHTKHPVLGWLPAMGKTTVMTDEYTATYDVNSLGMNDRPVEETLNRAKIRIMALGDSNTFGQGVSQPQAWPNRLEKMLFDGNAEAGTVYNLGVIGYSLGQYLLRMRELQELLQPQIILVGFSMANDLYDLLPPRLGGFTNEEHLGRVYFDLDKEGNLLEVHELVGKDPTQEAPHLKRTASLQIRQFLANYFAMYRRYRRLNLAMWIATHVRPAGESLWPGVDIALKKQPDNELDQHAWRLAEKIIQQIATEASAAHIKLVVVNIPHLAETYDDAWETSYGTLPNRYDRWIATERLGQICNRAGIYYIDTTPKFVEEARRTKRWLHYRQDRHPTVEGHRIIAETVLRGLKEQGLLTR